MFELRHSESLSSLGKTRNPLEHTDSLRRRCRSALSEPMVIQDSAGHTVFANSDIPPDMMSKNEERWWKEKAGKHFVTSKNKFLALLVDEIQQSAHGTGRPRHLGRFFNIVRGGNLPMVKDVIRTLQRLGMQEELNWVLGVNNESQHSATRISDAMQYMHAISYIIWAVLFFILTPVFYVFHVIILNANTGLRSRISQTVNLPIVFAVLSEEPEMVKFFLDMGCPLDGQDDSGNNVYHYLADISIDDPEKAVRCHGVICTCVPEVSDLKALIVDQMNITKFTALEFMAKYGSPHFLRYIMVDKSCIGTLRLGVSKNNLWVNDSNTIFDINDVNPLQTNEDQPEDCRTLNIWEFDISLYEKDDTFGKQSYLLQLGCGKSIEGMPKIDVAALIESKILNKWFAHKFSQYVSFSIFGHLLYLLVTVLLLCFVVLHGGDVDSTPLYGTFIKLEFKELSAAGYQASRHNISDNLSNHSKWHNTCRQWKISWKDDIIDTIKSKDVQIDNCTATALATLRQECHGVDTDYILSQTLNRPERGILTTFPVKKGIDCILIIFVIIDIVIREGFLMTNYNFEAKSLIYGIAPVMFRRFPGSYTEKILSYMMYVFYACYLCSNDFWRNSINDRNFFYSKYLSNIANYTGPEHDEQAEILKAAVYRVDSLATLTGNLVIICLMLRFLHTIHALRLLPGIGFFVITTKKMAKHLLQFTVVFCFVSLAFATIFYFVMRNNDCPKFKVEGFTTLFTSLFSAYQVALGYGEYDFTININAIIAYTAYTIISIMLLLNLVIAVMTTTVEELNQMPWKKALCCVEQWDEILGTEITVRTVFALFIYPGRAVRWLWVTYYLNHRRVWRNIKLKTKRTFEVIYFE